MTDLRDLVDPLLSDPPHAAPSLAELQARVDRRRRRRARAIGAGSILAVVLVVAGVLALPRDAELRVGDDTTAPGTTDVTRPPPTDAAVDTGVVVTVTPESAPLQGARRFEIRNTTDQPFALDCGGRLGLERWDGAQWGWVGTLAPAADPPYLRTTEVVGSTPCQDDPVVEPSGTYAVDLDLSTVVRTNGGGTVPAGREPLEPGWYRFGASPLLAAPLTIGGRFEITGDERPQEPTTTSTVGSVDQSSITIDLYPLDLAPAGEVLPTAVFAVDQDTIAVAWTGPCNQPADHVAFDAHDGEVELRLSVGTFVVNDCVGEPDDWMVTFDVPFTITDRVRLVARAAGIDGEVDRMAGTIVGSTGGGRRLPNPTPTSFRVVDADPNSPKLRSVLLSLPYPLVDAELPCDVSMSGHNGVMVPEVWVDITVSATASRCSDESLTLQLSPDSTILGLG